MTNKVKHLNNVLWCKLNNWLQSVQLFKPRVCINFRLIERRVVYYSLHERDLSSLLIFLSKILTSHHRTKLNISLPTCQLFMRVAFSLCSLYMRKINIGFHFHLAAVWRINFSKWNWPSWNVTSHGKWEKETQTSLII